LEKEQESERGATGSELDSGTLAHEYVQEMVEFVTLWDLVQQVTLTDQADQLLWRWTANGAYSSKSTYLVQFNGTAERHDEREMWRSTVLPDIACGGVLCSPAEGCHRHGGGREAELGQDRATFCEGMAGGTCEME